MVDLLDVALVAKQVHWNVVGPRFRSVRLQPDEAVNIARLHADALAERAVTLGLNPDGRAATVAGALAFEAVAPGWIQDRDAVRIMVQGLRAVSARMRERIRATADPDPVAQDVLIGVTAELEKHAWMFQAEDA